MNKQVWEESKAKALYDHLCGYYWEHGYMPAFRELADRFSTSTSFVNHNLDILEDRGLITRPQKYHGKARGIMLVGALHLPPPTFGLSEKDLDKINRQTDRWVNQLIRIGEPLDAFKDYPNRIKEQDTESGQT